MCGKPADVDNHTGLLVILQISVTNICMCASCVHHAVGLATWHSIRLFVWDGISFLEK